MKITTLGFLCLVFSGYFGFCQQVKPVYDWLKIERSIKQKENLKDLQQQISTIKIAAAIEKNDVALARGLYYGMLVRDLLTEDSLYFRNSAFIDSTLTAPGSGPVLKTIMHLMQARRIQLFLRKDLKFSRSTYEVRGAGVNYARLKTKTADSLVLEHLKAAKTLAATLPSLHGELNWLSSNADVFLFRSDLEDIAIVEIIGDALAAGAGNYTSMDSGSPIMNLDEQHFFAALEKIGSKLSWEKEVAPGWRDWLGKHRSDPEVYGYLAVLMRSATYECYRQDSLLDQSYERYLLHSISSPFPMVRAACAFQLSKIYLKEGHKYRSGYQPWNRKGFYKAMQVCQSYRPDLLRYPFYQEQVLLLEDKAHAKELGVSMQEKQLPDQPILLTVSYRNVPKLYYRIIRNHHLSGPPPTAASLLNQGKAGEVFRTDSVELTSVQDYNHHAVYIKLEPLALGNYHLLFAAKSLDSDSSGARIVSFSVTNLAAISLSDRVAVLHRKTGFPLNHIKITAVPVRKVGDVNEGKQIQIVSKGDTLLHRFKQAEQELPDDVFNKEEYDGDLNEYYDDYTELQVYTDRGIYRPGQQVFFKTILVSKDPKTGDLIIFNQSKGKVFSQWMKNNKPMVFLKDAKGRKVDSLKFFPDDYGSFSGTFTLPKNALPGNWNIDERFSNTYAYSGEFIVEEYKRPSFELVLGQQEEASLPGEPFEFRLKARSFAGANLAGIKVAYSLTRRPENHWGTAKIIDTLGYTDGQGELRIRVNDPLSAFTASPKERWLKVNYELEATASETTGEQTELKASHMATALQVDIQVKLKDFYLRSALPKLSVSVESLNKLFGKDSLSVEIYALEKDSKAYGVTTDQWKYSMEELKKWFTKDQLGLVNKYTKTKKLVFSERIPAAQGLVRLDAANLRSGEYELLVTTGREGQGRGAFSREFRVFDDRAPVSHGLEDFIKMPLKAYQRGDTATVYVYFPDSTYLISSFVYYAKYSKGIDFAEKQSSRLYAGGMLHRIQFVIPENCGNSMVFQYAYIRNGELFENDLGLFITEPPKHLPEIVVEKYRKVLAPGAKETFSVSVKTNNQNTASQLLTTLYDAALDKLAEHTFELKGRSDRTYSSRLRRRWSDGINENEQSAAYQLNGPFYPDEVPGVLHGKMAPGLFKGFNSIKLDEVLVDYGDRRSYTVSGFNIQNSVALQTFGPDRLLGYSQDLVILDGVPYEGKLASLNADLVTDALVIKGQDAVALYGSKAASGVLVLSTRGKIVLPAAEPPPAKIRKNFNETAFFFPAVYADKQGRYSFTFEMPESATTWNWKMMAHTKRGEFAYAQRELYTQLNLMVQANVPRLLYQGDEMVLQSRISNLDTLVSKGRISCTVEDGVTGAELTAAVLGNAAHSQEFALGAKDNTYAAFRIRVPEEQLNPLKVVITARDDRFADAEEHIIPVLSKRILVRQNQPLRFFSPDTLVRPPDLPAGAVMYGLGASIHPKPQSALLNSLPWLANYSYSCAEQVFNKFYANYTAYQLMRSDTSVRFMYMRALRVNCRDSGMKAAAVSEELMQNAAPWLGLQQQQMREREQMFELLDTMKSKAVMEGYLERLYKQQSTDGGIPWFEGGKSDGYVSAYLLAGFGKFNGELPQGSSKPRFQALVNKLIGYTDKRILDTRDIYNVFARSFWLREHPLSPGSLSRARGLLNDYWKNPDGKNLYSRILAILSGMRLFAVNDPLYLRSQVHLESVLQMAITDTVNGLRWKELADREQPDVSAEELIELLSMSFKGLQQEPELNAGLLNWILQTQTEHHWATTKGTSAALSLLTKVRGTAAGPSQAFKVKAGSQTMLVSDDLLTGAGTSFIPLGQHYGAVDLTKTNGALALGNLNWYYFTKPEALPASSEGLTVRKQFYLYSEPGNKWAPVKEDRLFKIGEKVKVILTVETLKPLRYVQLEDYLAAAFEPVDKSSGQQFQDKLSYYQAVRDTGLQLFVDYMPSGRSEISYELQVVNEGVFTGGPAVLSCMYDPANTAYSNSVVVHARP